MTKLKGPPRAGTRKWNGLAPSAYETKLLLPVLPPVDCGGGSSSSTGQADAGADRGADFEGVGVADMETDFEGVDAADEESVCEGVAEKEEELDRVGVGVGASIHAGSMAAADMFALLMKLRAELIVRDVYHGVVSAIMSNVDPSNASRSQTGIQVTTVSSALVGEARVIASAAE